MEDIYELAIIGGGISSCTFASEIINSGFKGKIAIFEAGRNLGGRASSRLSLKNKGWILNHGAPNLNIHKEGNGTDLNKFLKKLLEKEIIEADQSEFYTFDKRLNLSNINDCEFTKGNLYMPNTYMSDLSENILLMNNKFNKIDLYFETLINNIIFINNYWVISSTNGIQLKCRFLVSSSSLILHDRSIDVLGVNQIPLRRAIKFKRSSTIDKIINNVNHQDHIKRLSFLIYTNSDYSYKDSYEKKNRYFKFDEDIVSEFGFERIIFQRQLNNSLAIVIQTTNQDLFFKGSFNGNKLISIETLLDTYNKLFEKSKIINKLSDFKDISLMEWRASQPFGFMVSSDLQICKKYKIGFCGDWFDTNGFARIEGAILSGINLSKKILEII